MKNIEKLFEKAVVSKIKTNHIGAKLVYNENGYGILTYISNLDGAFNMDFKESKKMENDLKFIVDEFEKLNKRIENFKGKIWYF